MILQFCPRVTGGFVHHLMRDTHDATNVSEKLAQLPITEEQKHDLVKAITIAALRDFNCNINEKINQIKSGQ